MAENVRFGKTTEVICKVYRPAFQCLFTLSKAGAVILNTISSKGGWGGGAVRTASDWSKFYANHGVTTLMDSC